MGLGFETLDNMRHELVIFELDRGSTTRNLTRKMYHTGKACLSASSADNLVYVWMRLKKAGYLLDKKNRSKFAKMLAWRYP